MTTSQDSTKPVRVGLIGCGEIAQVVHIPTLLFMQKWFIITYLCDISAEALEHCNGKLFGSAKTTTNPEELCSSDLCDAVIIGNSDEYHAVHALLALKHGKHVFVEKPLALTKRDVYAIIEAEKSSKGKVMVGQMRRYAAPFEDAIKEIGGIDKILYARVRGMIAAFVVRYLLLTGSKGSSGPMQAS
jgi:predicted dehydrogenase